MSKSSQIDERAHINVKGAKSSLENERFKMCRVKSSNTNPI